MQIAQVRQFEGVLFAANAASEHLKYRSMEGEATAQFNAGQYDSPVVQGGKLLVTGKVEGELVLAGKRMTYLVKFTLGQNTDDQPPPNFSVDLYAETKAKYTNLTLYRSVVLDALKLRQAPTEDNVARFAGWNRTASLQEVLSMLLASLW